MITKRHALYRNWTYFQGLPFPKRATEILALIATLITLLLFRHTYNLTKRFNEIEELQHNVLRHSQSVVDGKAEVENLFDHLKNTGQIASLDVNLLNNTRYAESQIVVFNRIPRAGSSMFVKLIEKLASRNNFTGYEDTDQNLTTFILAPTFQKHLALLVSEVPQPAVYNSHVVYTNFAQFNLPKPIHISLVRDPVERVISWFYYIRSPPYYIERSLLYPDEGFPKYGWVHKEFETCATSNDYECNYIEGNKNISDFRRQSIYFCGHDEQCLPFNRKEVIRRAKLAVEKEYSVVGVLEDFETTLAVLEKYIPRFFAGAMEIYNENQKLFKSVNKNKFKPPVSDEIKVQVRKKFSREIEFYDFCKKRLHTQHIAANLKN